MSFVRHITGLTPAKAAPFRWNIILHGLWWRPSILPLNYRWSDTVPPISHQWAFQLLKLSVITGASVWI